EPTALESLVIDHESASIPEQDLDPVATAAHEGIKVPGERIHAPLVTHDREEPVVTAAQIDRLSRQVDVDARRKRQHRSRSRVTSSATYAGSTPTCTRTTTPPTPTSMRPSSPLALAALTRTGSNRGALRATLP